MAATRLDLPDAEALPESPDKLPIVTYPAPGLRVRCAPVESFDEKLAALAKQMIAAMHENEGVGLAAPQVGVPLRLFVCNETGKPEDDRVFVNPVLSGHEGAATGDEGCLSIPGVTVAVRRAERCSIAAVDVQGRPISASGAGLLARCWQHEVDHLDGRLIIDRMSEADAIANRKKLRELEAKFKKRK